MGRALTLEKAVGRLLQDAIWMGGPRSLPTAGAVIAAQQRELPSVGPVLLVSRGFCQRTGDTTGESP